MLWEKSTPHFRPYIIYTYIYVIYIYILHAGQYYDEPMNQQVLGYTWVHYFQTNPDQDPWLQIRYWERITCLHMDAFDISIQAFISLEVIVKLGSWFFFTLNFFWADLTARPARTSLVDDWRSPPCCAEGTDDCSHQWNCTGGLQGAASTVSCSCEWSQLRWDMEFVNLVTS